MALVDDEERGKLVCQRDRRIAEDKEGERQKRSADNNTEIGYALPDRRKASS